MVYLLKILFRCKQEFNYTSQKEENQASQTLRSSYLLVRVFSPLVYQLEVDK